MNVMSSYKKYYYLLKALIEELNERDRVLVVSITLIIIVALWYSLFYQPINQSRQEATIKSDEVQKNTQAFISKKLIIDSVLSSPNTPGLLAHHQELTNKIKELDAQFVRYNQRFISKKDLSKLLHDMLKQTMGLTIENFSTVTLANSAPQVIQKNGTVESPPTAALTNAMTSTQYRLVLKGTYFPVMNYLQRLEQLPWNLYWDKLDYKVQTYPEALVTIEFYTLKPESERQSTTPRSTP